VLQREAFDRRMTKKKPTLLVADDETWVRDPVSTLLQLAGYEVLTARDCNDAMEVFRTNAETIVAVLLDFSMPGGSTRDLFDELQHVRPNVPIILMSGYAEESVMGRFKGMGVVGFLQKPFTKNDLLDEVRKALDHPAA